MKDTRCLQNTIATFFIAFIMLACNKNQVYREVDDNFPANRWAKIDSRTFDFKIETAGNYDMAVIFSHVYETPLENIPMKIELQLPSGESEKLDIVMHLRDESGEGVSDCAGDYCDFTQGFIKGRTLEPGNYKVKISNTFDYDFMPNVLGIGVEVNKSSE